jgi:hypothetical protein
MKQILIGKNVNYAASKASATADTATSPELLRDGAIGFYLESTNALIPAAGTGLSTAKKFFIAQGTATGCIVTPILDKRSTFKQVFNEDYTAPVRQVSYVGYNGSSGSLTTPTIVENDEAYIKIIETTGGRQVFPKQTYNAILAASALDYDVAAGLAYEINNVAFATSTTDFVVAEVMSDGTLGNLALGAATTLVAVNGSRTLTLTGGAATHDAAVGDYLKFHPSAQVTNVNGALYKVTAITTTTITLDRAYEGASQTFTEAEGEGTRVKRVTAITEAGVRITSSQDGKHFRLAVGGVIEDATISYTTPFNPGSGTFAQVAQLEKDFLGFSRGSWNRVGPYAAYGTPTLYADSTATYDMYNIQVTNMYKDKSGMDASIGEDLYVIIANHSSATTVNTALDTIIALI